ncbi:hypothetical protein ACJJTC_004170, partial [Scirpophaga incertulas]
QSNLLDYSCAATSSFKETKSTATSLPKVYGVLSKSPMNTWIQYSDELQDSNVNKPIPRSFHDQSTFVISGNASAYKHLGMNTDITKLENKSIPVMSHTDYSNNAITANKTVINKLSIPSYPKIWAKPWYKRSRKTSELGVETSAPRLVMAGVDITSISSCQVLPQSNSSIKVKTQDTKSKGTEHRSIIARYASEHKPADTMISHCKETLSNKITETGQKNLSDYSSAATSFFKETKLAGQSLPKIFSTLSKSAVDTFVQYSGEIHDKNYTSVSAGGSADLIEEVITSDTSVQVQASCHDTDKKYTAAAAGVSAGLITEILNSCDASIQVQASCRDTEADAGSFILAKQHRPMATMTSTILDQAYKTSKGNGSPLLAVINNNVTTEPVNTITTSRSVIENIDQSKVKYEASPSITSSIKSTKSKVHDKESSTSPLKSCSHNNNGIDESKVKYEASPSITNSTKSPVHDKYSATSHQKSCSRDNSGSLIAGAKNSLTTAPITIFKTSTESINSHKQRTNIMTLGTNESKVKYEASPPITSSTKSPVLDKHSATSHQKSCSHDNNDSDGNRANYVASAPNSLTQHKEFATLHLESAHAASNNDPAKAHINYVNDLEASTETVRKGKMMVDNFTSGEYKAIGEACALMKSSVLSNKSAIVKEQYYIHDNNVLFANRYKECDMLSREKLKTQNLSLRAVLAQTTVNEKVARRVFTPNLTKHIAPPTEHCEYLTTIPKHARKTTGTVKRSDKFASQVLKTQQSPIWTKQANSHKTLLYCRRAPLTFANTRTAWQKNVEKNGGACEPFIA